MGQCRVRLSANIDRPRPSQTACAKKSTRTGPAPRAAFSEGGRSAFSETHPHGKAQYAISMGARLPRQPLSCSHSLRESLHRQDRHTALPVVRPASHGESQLEKAGRAVPRSQYLCDTVCASGEV